MKLPRLLHLTVFLCLALGLLAGCSSNRYEPKPIPYAMPVDPPEGATMLTANTYAGDALASMLLRRMGPGKGILVTPFVQMEQIETSSPFGRTSMQQVSSRVGQHGFSIIEVRLANALTIDRKQGELMLTRDSARLLENEHNAHAVLVGMYSRAMDKIFVSVRAIRLDDSTVIASYEYYLPLAGDVRYMLSDAHTAPDHGNAGTWSKYASRGQAFPAATTQPTPKKAAANTASHVERNTPSAHSSAQPATREERIPLILENSPPRTGGKVIDPSAPPAPLRNKK